jgi:hypothetical protein
VQRADNRIGGTRAMVLCVQSISFGGADIPINFVYRTQVLPVKFENDHVGCFTEARRTPDDDLQRGLEFGQRSADDFKNLRCRLRRRSLSGCAMSALGQTDMTVSICDWRWQSRPGPSAERVIHYLQRNGNVVGR